MNLDADYLQIFVTSISLDLLRMSLEMKIRCVCYFILRFQANKCSRRIIKADFLENESSKEFYSLFSTYFFM